MRTEKKVDLDADIEKEITRVLSRLYCVAHRCVRFEQFAIAKRPFSLT